ncbi:Protein phosphatase Slingshot 1 like [Actinidia chinensis var. chinensis]|uniref:Protein phosphatase Slingshot 1 like n=1 Tax=Actinidia chinensis var. chinensis TaxID=1590841 RepID=A0A2R6QZR1_ACTCC|nr:Protein phosphatase Slingshot 1 like [Actinidia chinensis var. chinensis]
MKSSLSPLYQSPNIAAKDQQDNHSGCDHDIRGKEIAITVIDTPKKIESKPSMDINESAEAFINKFKQQLLIQRLESIENYEQMLKRGT